MALKTSEERAAEKAAAEAYFEKFRPKQTDTPAAAYASSQA